MANHDIHIGTSGWHYKHLRKTFYPDNLRETDWLTYYSKIFNTVELNNSFYRMPATSTFEKWKASAPRESILP